ncbi:LCP family protein [Paenibacillus protaetiae]|uniref:LytR family transcriptional regulator n=1 Tax=Paenibacillus protaetiae TaxID=2509456 RepID=A0A4P6EVP3_9BACL|nr:LCP family protein [Paenibacillus protaetiae]QAY67074.1 LytR family transcriptional regulator [Paenibacillus protaetiae]
MRSKPTKKRPWKWVLITLLVLVVAGIAGATYWGVGVYNALDDFSKPQDESRFSQFEPTDNEPPKWQGTERVNILLLGGDARGLAKNQVPRSDSILIASIDPLTKKADLFSVLRDTYVDIDGHGKDRINTAITYGGPQLAMKTIGDLLGLPIQYYVYTDFEGFKALVDSIGGIDYDVEKDMHYTDNADDNRYDIDLKAGYQHLDGDHALQYVRFRHDAMSDFTRTERQRNFIMAVAGKMQSTWNIVQMGKILNNVSDYIETNLSVMDMLKLGQLGVESHFAGTAQIPPMDQISEERVGGASVIGIKDPDDIKAFVQQTLAADDSAATPDPNASADPNASPDTNASGPAADSGSDN